MNGAGPGPEAIALLIAAVWLFWIVIAIAFAALTWWLIRHPRKIGPVALGAVASVALALLSGAAWPS